ncbi:hypothetical protein CTM_07776 [Clostridium tetanomorphum DSM 665]|nr:hypothetical protein CTM_07776 [Clostridium tetanomorphum DSM 665]
MVIIPATAEYFNPSSSAIIIASDAPIAVFTVLNPISFILTPPTIYNRILPYIYLMSTLII